MPTIFVTKFDGTMQPFQREKIVDTCVRMGATKEDAKKIADIIERKIYDGIATKKILQMIFRLLKKYRPAVEHQIDLREAISILRPKPDFERFVHLLLEEHGYEVTPNQIIRGKCVEHEIDGIARKKNETILVEVKHHYNHHTYTGLDVGRIAWATFEDLEEGFEQGLNSVKFTGIMIVCNTKLTEHAKQYAKCRGIMHIGWKAPPEHGLERMIEEKKLYPITLLKKLSKRDKTKLLDEGIIALKQLVDCEVNELSRKTGMRRDKLQTLVRKAKEILS